MDEFVFDEVCTQVHVFFTFMAQSLHIPFPITHKPAQGTITKCGTSHILPRHSLHTHADRYAHMHKNVQMNAEQNIQRRYKSTIMHKYIIKNTTLCSHIPIMVDVFLCYSSAVAVLKSKYVFIFQRKRWRINGHC